MVQQVLVNEKQINEFIADLNELSERHGLIIDEELPPYQLHVYTTDYELVGKIKYNEEVGKYQEDLSQTQKEIRAEANNDGGNNKQILQELLTEVENLQEEFLDTVVDKNSNIVTEEEELIYWVALDKIEDTTENWDLWDEIRHEPKQYTWKKIEDFHWKVIKKGGEVILEITKEDIHRYVNEDVLDKHYSKFL